VTEPGAEEKRESGPRPWRAVPIPTELHEAVTAGVLIVADVLRQEGQQRKAHDQLFDMYLKTRSELGSDEEQQLEFERLQAARDADDLDLDDDDEERRRECAAATCRPGRYAVIVSKVSDYEDVFGAADIDYSAHTVAPYLEGRLGYTMEGAEKAITRVRHVAPETVLEGVDLDDAVRIKGELVALGCKAQVVERAMRSTREGARQPIPESVRNEVWRRDQGRCVDCGSRERLEFDHIIPVSEGGSNTARNIELRCESCNRRKGARI
jgi:hypothetical protein